MKINFEAIDKIIGAQNKTEERQDIHGLNALSTQQTHCLPKILTLQIGVRYMVTLKIYEQGGSFNGATGILKFVELIDSTNTNRNLTRYTLILMILILVEMYALVAHQLCMLIRIFLHTGLQFHE